MPIQSLLITGLTGFVGSHVAEAIAGRVPSIRALVRSSSNRKGLESFPLEFVPGSLEDPESVQRAVQDMDVVVHMAGATRAISEAEFMHVNAAGTTAIVEAIRRAPRPPRRLIYLSSLAAVGPARGGRPVQPDDPPEPLTAYGRTKLAAERICAELERVCEVVILRAPAVYGPRDRDMYHFFRLATRGFLPVPSGPNRRLQLVHVGDLAHAIALAATVERVRGVYHIAEPRAYDWVDVCRSVASAVGRKARLLRIPGAAIAFAGATSEILGRVTGKPSIFSRDKARELLAPGWLCETEAASRDFGFHARIPLDRGLNETASWYRTHGWL